MAFVMPLKLLLIGPSVIEIPSWKPLVPEEKIGRFSVRYVETTSRYAALRVISQQPCEATMLTFLVSYFARLIPRGLQGLIQPTFSIGQCSHALCSCGIESHMPPMTW